MSTRSTPDGRNSSLGRDTRMQLFVGNVCRAVATRGRVLTRRQLPYRVRWQDLKDLFRKAGTVLRADVSLGPDNRSRGYVSALSVPWDCAHPANSYGTVLFGNPDDAARAVGQSP